MNKPPCDESKTEGEGIALTVFCDYSSAEVTEIDQEPEFICQNGLFRADVLLDAIGMLNKLYDESVGIMTEEICKNG